MVLSAAMMKAGMRIIGVWGGFYTNTRASASSLLHDQGGVNSV